MASPGSAPSQMLPLTRRAHQPRQVRRHSDLAGWVEKRRPLRVLAVGDRCCAEGLYRNALVAHLEYLEFLRASWRVQDYTVPWPRLHQRARQRRLPADAVAIEIDLI